MVVIVILKNESSNKMSEQVNEQLPEPETNQEEKPVDEPSYDHKMDPGSERTGDYSRDLLTDYIRKATGKIEQQVKDDKQMTIDLEKEKKFQEWERERNLKKQKVLMRRLKDKRKRK